MELNALILMTISWGFSLGLLTFCVVKLAKNPQNASVINNNNKKKD